MNKDFKKDLDDIIAVQKYDGNWNYDPYMLGMANGLLLARAIINHEDPEFLEPPETFLCDEPYSGNISFEDYINPN